MPRWASDKGIVSKFGTEAEIGPGNVFGPLKISLHSDVG